MTPAPSRPWIPPIQLAGGIAMQLVAWAIAIRAGSGITFGLALAWIHAVALGWLTVVALGILVHVVPAFTGLRWRGEGVARAAAVAVLAGAVALVGGFLAGSRVLVDGAAALLAASIVAYVTVALATLAQRADDRTEAAIARALRVPLVALAATALLGAALAATLSGTHGAPLAAAPAHALLGIVGWLTILASGVSTRTFRPMLGRRPRTPVLHIVSGTAFAAGTVVAACGAVWSLAAERAGVLIAAAGAAAYLIDAVRALRGATTPQRGVHAFVGASLWWLAVAASAAVAASWGVTAAAALAVVAALAGWVGQLVNAHLHHLGVRLLLTLVRGDDDETRPWEVVDPRLTWTSFAANQLAVAAVAAAACGAPPILAAVGGAIGCGGVAATALNAAGGARRAARLGRAPIALR